MFKLPALTLAATLAAGAAAALPANYVFDNGPVIDFDSQFGETIDIIADGSGVNDLAFSALIPGFSLDAPFDGTPEVDFAGVVDTLGLTSIFDVPFLSVEDGGNVLLESFDIVDVTFGDDTLEVLFSDLGGSAAGDFGGFALFTLTTLGLPTTPNPWETATSVQSYEVVGTIASVSAIPLPASLWLLLAGVGAVGALRLRKAG